MPALWWPTAVAKVKYAVKGRSGREQCFDGTTGESAAVRDGGKDG